MKRFIVLFVVCILLSGCAGLADYTIDLENGYRIVRLSANKIQIYGEEAVNDGIEHSYNYLYVPTKVHAVSWDEQYIVAKQLRLQLDERGFEVPPKNPSERDFSYWIIEINKNIVQGPLTKNQLDYESNELGINIEFTAIEKLKKKH